MKLLEKILLATDFIKASDINLSNDSICSRTGLKNKRPKKYPMIPIKRNESMR